MPDWFEDAATSYGYTRTPRHVGVTKKDTRRPGFERAVRAANALGYPVLVRGAGGGAIAGGPGTFGFSIIRPAVEDEDTRRGIQSRYDEAASLALSVIRGFGVEAEPGEVRDEFCPGDQSIRVGDFENGMKLVGIAQRVTKRAASVGGIVLVSGEDELARVLQPFYGAMDLPFRPASVGSLSRAGSDATLGDAMDAFAEEARLRYSAKLSGIGTGTLEKARGAGADALIELAT